MRKTLSINNAQLATQTITNTQSHPTPIIFLHDSYGCMKTWKDFPKILCDHLERNGIYYDRKGYGESSPFSECPRPIEYHQEEARDFIALLDHLQIQKCSLFGFSDGGNIALEAMALDPGRFEWGIVEGVHVIIEDITLQGIEDWHQRFLSSPLERQLKRYHGDKAHWVHSVWVETWLQESRKEWNCIPSLQKIKKPVFVFQGDGDEFGSIDQLETVKKNVPAFVRADIVSDAGHRAHFDQTQWVLDQCKDFISCLDGK